MNTLKFLIFIVLSAQSFTVLAAGYPHNKIERDYISSTYIEKEQTISDSVPPSLIYIYGQAYKVLMYLAHDDKIDGLLFRRYSRKEVSEEWVEFSDTRKELDKLLEKSEQYRKSNPAPLISMQPAVNPVTGKFETKFQAQPDPFQDEIDAVSKKLLRETLELVSAVYLSTDGKVDLLLDPKYLYELYIPEGMK